MMIVRLVRLALTLYLGLANGLVTGLSLTPSLVPTESMCGGRILISSPGYLTSPWYPSNYPLSEQCDWIVEAPEKGQRILINFNPHFDLEDRECKYDYIEVYDGADDKATRLLKHCGKIAPGPIQSSQQQVFIRFVSDYETSGAGFSIRYEINKLAHTDCSANLTGPNGVLRSPGFPEKYPNNLACSYTVWAPSGEEIQLLFHAFSLEPDTTPPTGVTCRFDWLEIWDGYPLVGHFIGRFCGDSNPGRVVSHTGILTITFTTDNAIAKEGFEASYTIRQRRHTHHNSQADSCMDPLGMESGDIGPSQIRARSQYNPSWAPERARLNYKDNGWTPSEDSSREWIEVDLGFLKYVSAIGTQGAISKETRKPYYVKTYKVLLSTNGEDWLPVKEEGKHKVYAPCSAMLGMVSGQIADSQISVWPPVERSWLADSARLMTESNGWTLAAAALAPVSPPAEPPFLQLDLGRERLVSGLVVQGGRLKEKPVFVRRFRVAHSTDGTVWNNVLEQNSTHNKLFVGNLNHDTPEVRELGPLMMRFLRVYPERGAPDGMGLRLEVLGCDPQAPTTPPPPTTPTVTTAAVTMTTGATSPPLTPLATVTPEDCEGHEGCDDYGPTEDNPGPVVILEDPFPIPEYLWFSCDFGWGSPSYCTWTPETDGGADWLFHIPGTTPNPPVPNQEHTGSPGIFIYAAPSSDSLERETELGSEGERGIEGEKEWQEERMSARLAGPVLTAPVSEMCVSFWYNTGKAHTHSDSLQLKLRRLREREVKEEEDEEEEEEEEKENEMESLLWMVGGEQMPRWREGRVLLPSANTSYQVVFEAVIGSHSSGGLALDDIKILDQISPAECKDPEDKSLSTSSSPEVLSLSTTPGVLFFTFPTDSPVTGMSSGLGSGSSGSNGASVGSGMVLRSLDPILITIIAMSALGVLLGAVCGVLLYCACGQPADSIGTEGQGSEPPRNISAMKSYNFELVKKEKLNSQKSFMEV
ncbi:neuropilin-1a-like [Alosa pseudoharengus]|uniref:neuropilin-1a-like n=1 Tax=Alosa pseudoharengus TaxID=34774 RepID=UPI003F8891D3